MDSKAKKQLSTSVNCILKDNDFFRLAGRWVDDNTLHIGVQPKNFWSQRYSSIAIEKQNQANYDNCVRLIKSLTNVVRAEKDTYIAGYRMMAGIRIEVKG